jgi:hypothetical protein
VTTRMIANVPKVAPDKKGRNPGPGERNVPILLRMDSIQTNTEIASQKRPLSRSGRFAVPP